MELKDELQRVKYLLSNESLELLPEYQQRIEVSAASCLINFFSIIFPLTLLLQFLCRILGIIGFGFSAEIQ